MRHTVESIIKRTVRNGDCIEWTGGRFNNGYGGIRHEDRTWKTHRLMYALHEGKIPEGGFILHTCNNPPCVNIEHLILGNQFDNMSYASAQGRMRSHLPSELIDKVGELIKSGVKPREVARLTGVSGNTVYRLKKKLFPTPHCQTCRCF